VKRCPLCRIVKPEDAKVAKAVAAGTLIPQPCVHCGARRAHAHHEDYSRPLDVIWLCARCHAAHHRGIAREDVT
jgi:hypothetical protein